MPFKSFYHVFHLDTWVCIVSFVWDHTRVFYLWFMLFYFNLLCYYDLLCRFILISKNTCALTPYIYQLQPTPSADKGPGDVGMPVSLWVWYHHPDEGLLFSLAPDIFVGLSHTPPGTRAKWKQCLVSNWNSKHQRLKLALVPWSFVASLKDWPAMRTIGIGCWDCISISNSKETRWAKTIRAPHEPSHRWNVCFRKQSSCYAIFEAGLLLPHGCGFSWWSWSRLG